MLTPKKKYCYILSYGLPPDSILRELCIKDALLDNEGLVKLFEIDDFQLSLRLSSEGKLEVFFCKTEDYQEQINIDAFREKSLEILIKSLNRVQFAFTDLRNQRRYTPFERNRHQSNIYDIEVLDFETRNKIFQSAATIYKVVGEMSFLGFPKNVLLQKFCEVLVIQRDNIDEYIDRFLSLENLNSDPVLHFVTLYSLYEYINKTSGNRLKELFTNKGLEKKFRNTRNFAAHGKVEGQELKEVLENFLGVSPIGFYSFDRYNPSHVNLINEVIGEAQPIIQQYLRGELGLNQ
ncbi:MAG: hypothetical protein ACK5XC_07580 [Pseudanabaena sp.]|jgi:hypothetical protein